VQCDRNDVQKLKEIMDGGEFECVIDNICYTPTQAGAIVEALAGRCQHYVMTSSVMSYLNLYLAGEPLKEEDWDRPCSTAGMEDQYSWSELEYAENKRRCESIILNQAEIPSTILRLQNVVGEADFSGKSEHLHKSICDGLYLRGLEQDTYQQIYARDLGEIFATVAESPTRKGARAINIGLDPISLGDYVQLFVGEYDKQPKFRNVPDAIGPFPRNVILDVCKQKVAITRNLTDYKFFLPAMGRKLMESNLAMIP
jgi:nucleoside-diphosphate-sugar epimerase